MNYFEQINYGMQMTDKQSIIGGILVIGFIVYAIYDFIKDKENKENKEEKE
jgi:hypothetical protein